MERNRWMEILFIGVLPALLTAGMLSVTGTWYISSTIATVRSDNMAAMSALIARVAADEERILAMEKIDTSRYAEDLAFKTEMRATINHVIDILTDVRVEVGPKHK